MEGEREGEGGGESIHLAIAQVCQMRCPSQRRWFMIKCAAHPIRSAPLGRPSRCHLSFREQRHYVLSVFPLEPR